jgi:hypothetical protein
MDLVSPRPFWPLKNGLLSVYPALRQDLKCDVVILGAGIIRDALLQRPNRNARLFGFDR